MIPTNVQQVLSRRGALLIFGLDDSGAFHCVIKASSSHRVKCEVVAPSLPPSLMNDDAPAPLLLELVVLEDGSLNGAQPRLRSSKRHGKKIISRDGEGTGGRE